jgi:uroporphyrinogen III methyltransferase/synthase
MNGIVYLVGAGPGDPGLLTVKGLNVIEKAEVILFDQLVDERIRELFPLNAEQIFVGKEGGLHHVTQDETVALIVEKAKLGKRVLRLKGGDPYVFGRGGEEAEACVAAGVPFEVVPGITSGVAAAAYAGIPVTHRDASASMALITGHRRADRDSLDIPTPDAETLVYYMGIKNLSNVTEALINAGRSAHTPVAIIHRGTTPLQRTVTGDLETIGDVVKKSGITPPALIVVGEVVRYRDTLSWFETKPLFGTKILITRPRKQSMELREKLEEKGAAVVSIPAIEIQGLPDYGQLDRAIGELTTYDYLVFTSVNGVSAFFERLFEKGLDGRALAGMTTACMGPRTAKELNSFHIGADLIPKKFVAEYLLETFPADMTGKRVLIPRALEAREILPDGLRTRGAEVDVVPAYRTVGAAEILDVPGDIDIALFTSSSTVAHFLKRAKLPSSCSIGCIGPITASTLLEHGMQVDIEASEHTIPGMVLAIEEYVKGIKS